MKGAFFQRLRDYYQEVAAVLRGEANVSSVFPNATDIGISRENVYAEFLRQHAPSKCNIFLGGFIFGKEGNESGQLDVIITTDTTPRFNFHNKDSRGKSFSPVEGTLGVASIKSTLDKKELEDALKGIADIPETSSLESRTTLGIQINNYQDWPFKIIYASNGITAETILKHLNNYYIANPHIPIYRRPNIIHVSGKYVIMRVLKGMSTMDIHTKQSTSLEEGTFTMLTRNPDIQAIIWTLDGLQQRATASNHILYTYNELINKINNI